MKCPRGRWWWPWHIGRYAGPCSDLLVDPCYLIKCKRCHQVWRVEE